MTDNIFVIIPSLNPDERLINTVVGMLDIGFKKIILVNDGSDAEHLRYFRRLRKISRSYTARQITARVRHSRLPLGIF